MITQELLDYLQQQYELGKDIPTLDQEMRSVGWSDSDIASALGQIGKSQATPALPQDPVAPMAEMNQAPELPQDGVTPITEMNQAPVLPQEQAPSIKPMNTTWVHESPYTIPQTSQNQSPQTSPSQAQTFEIPGLAGQQVSSAPQGNPFTQSANPAISSQPTESAPVFPAQSPQSVQFTAPVSVAGVPQMRTMQSDLDTPAFDNSMGQIVDPKLTAYPPPTAPDTFEVARTMPQHMQSQAQAFQDNRWQSYPPVQDAAAAQTLSSVQKKSSLGSIIIAILIFLILALGGYFVYSEFFAPSATVTEADILPLENQ
jgi:hypothetical protein